MNLACLGDLGFDRYQNLNKTFWGGCSLNVARAYRTVLSDAAIGIFSPRPLMAHDLALDRQNIMTTALELLNQEQIQLIGPAKSGPWPTQTIELLESGEKKFINYDEGFWNNYTLNSQEQTNLLSYPLWAAVAFTQNLAFVDSFLKIKRQSFLAMDFLNGADFNYDFDRLLPYFSYVDLPVLGLDEAGQALEVKIEQWCRAKNRQALITKAHEGAIFFDGPEKFLVQAQKVQKVVDSTGAGDCFFGTFLATWKSQKLSIEKSLQYAASMAAVRVASLGP